MYREGKDKKISFFFYGEICIRKFSHHEIFMFLLSFREFLVVNKYIFDRENMFLHRLFQSSFVDLKSLTT
jgi:hypothetical protein